MSASHSEESDDTSSESSDSSELEFVLRRQGRGHLWNDEDLVFLNAALAELAVQSEVLNQIATPSAELERFNDLTVAEVVRGLVAQVSSGARTSRHGYVRQLDERMRELRRRVYMLRIAFVLLHVQTRPLRDPSFGIRFEDITVNTSFGAVLRKVQEVCRLLKAESIRHFRLWYYSYRNSGDPEFTDEHIQLRQVRTALYTLRAQLVTYNGALLGGWYPQNATRPEPPEATPTSRPDSPTVFDWDYFLADHEGSI